MSATRRRIRAGFTLVEMVIVVAIVAMMAALLTNISYSRQSTIGGQMGMTEAFEMAKREAHGPIAGATIVFSTTQSGNAQAVIYDGIAGTTFVNTPVQRIDIPAILSSTPAVTSGGGSPSLIFLFSKDGNFTYGKWAVGSPYTPADCANSVSVKFQNASGSTLGSMTATCGSQIPTFYNSSGTPIAT